MEIGAFEAKNRLGMLLDRGERGEEIVITWHGKSVTTFRDSRRRDTPTKSPNGFAIVFDLVSETVAWVPGLWKLKVGNIL